MNLETRDYVQNALKTESNDFEAILKRLESHETIRLLHAAIGMATESAELLDMLKKHIFYGKPLDKVNANEEIFDQMWYQAVAVNALGRDSFNEGMETNIAKLKARYGEKFSENSALNRNLENEEKILIAGIQ